ncbi:hypothetical protein HK097_010832 [Rhizophlyctis rosea]|uniref:F-box domain-containing protein n=1 Tax=Rhizophlyctis rosea TaxID=64517 RepID=A0AAD5X7X7_9FUNG|nr:hypothetical protein HK097_010832 [Rhizophlyctis rosea]
MLDPTLTVPATEEELDEFRKAWKAEVSTKKVVSKPAPADKPRSAASSASHAPILAALENLKISDATPSTREPAASSSSKDAHPTVSAIVAPAFSIRTEPLEPAMQAYIQAVSDERVGNLSAAIRGYREATRLDRDIDIKFRNWHRSLPSERKEREERHDPNAEFYTYYHLGQNDEHVTALPADQPVSEVIERFKGENVSFVRDKEGKRSLVLDLPYEIVTQILRWVILRDQGAVARLSLVSKKSAVMCYEQSIWRFMCERMHGPTKGLRGLTEELNLSYGNDWLKMWLDKPRLRRDGLYISRVNYIRQGQAESFYAPVHLVTYFRFFRFWGDGRCAMWTTTTEPSIAVKQMSMETRQKGWMGGGYVLTGKTVHVELKDPDRPRHVFKCTLTLSSTKRGRHNKLAWVEYWVEKVNDPNFKSDIPLTSLKPFIFSRVKSYRVI